MKRFFCEISLTFIMDDDLFAAFGDDDDEPQTSRRHVVQEQDPKDGEKK